MEALVSHESAGNTLNLNYSILYTRLSTIQNNASRWKYVGVIDDDIVALIKCSQFETCCTSSGKQYPYIEITRVEVPPNKRNGGVFRDFVFRMARICSMLHVALVVGCVEGSRMKSIMQKNGCTWQKLVSDPTSYIYMDAESSRKCKRKKGLFLL